MYLDNLPAATNIFVSALFSPTNIKTPEKISLVVPDQLGTQIRAGGDPNNREHPRQPSKKLRPCEVAIKQKKIIKKCTPTPLPQNAGFVCPVYCCISVIYYC